VDKIPTSVAAEVLDGARSVCAEAGIPLAGGHSIDSQEPIFGLSVNGTVKPNHLKRNSTAEPGCSLFLTKPLGVGIITTAEKRGIVSDEHREAAIRSMCTLNSIGQRLSSIPGVRAMTDVTGFGLLGHLREMCDGSNVSSELYFESIPVLKGVDYYLDQKSSPGGTKRNWTSYGELVDIGIEGDVVSRFERDYKRLSILCDPQTSGGLLIAVLDDGIEEFRDCLAEHNLESYAKPIGKCVERVHKMSVRVC
jgi:selenide,water dikinase